MADRKCDATRVMFQSDAEYSEPEENEGGEGDGGAIDAANDPLTAQLRDLSATASAMVRALEANVGNFQAQKSEVIEQLRLCVDLTAGGADLALEEILEWYSVLSILACSFPTQRELSDSRKKREKREKEQLEQESPAPSPAPSEEAVAAEGGAGTDRKRSPVEAMTAAEHGVDLDATVPAPRSDASAEDPPQLSSSSPPLPQSSPDVESAEASQGDGSEGKSSSDQGPPGIVDESLELPPLLLRSTDVGLPLQPMFIGAANEKDAGQWFMGLQGLRESPAKSIEKLAGTHWKTWQQTHCRYLLRSVRALKNCQQLRPARLLHEWLAVNDYCDWVQHHFVEIFTAEVLSEWYTRAGTWCQGSANLAMSLLVGVDSWQMCRDFMNMRSREFRRDPKVAAGETRDNVETLMEMLRRPPQLPFAVYVELDCWNWSPAVDLTEGPAGAPAVSPVPPVPSIPPPSSSSLHALAAPEAMDLETAPEAVTVDTVEKAAETRDDSSDDAAEIAEDVYVPLDVMHSGPTNGEITKQEESLAPPAAAPPPPPAPAGTEPARDAKEAADLARERLTAAEVAEQESLDGRGMEGAEPTLVYGRKVTSRLYPEASASARPNGGHVFLIQIEVPEGAELDAEGRLAEGQHLPPECYTIYSSWSGRYTLQQWMEQRPEMTQMSSSAFQIWLAALRSLLRVSIWSDEAQKLIAFLFGAENIYEQAPSSASDQGGTPLGPPEEVGAATYVQDDKGGEGESTDESEDEEDQFMSPADGWSISNEEEVLWELHFWARTYDRNQLEHNAAVIEHLHKVARQDHEAIVGRMACEVLPQLDKLQARTLHSKPFGHRCARNSFDSGKSSNDADEGEEGVAEEAA